MRIEKIISLFLGLYLFGFLINGLTKIKYIGLYGAILFFIYFFTKNKNIVFQNFKKIFSKYKVILTSLLLFSISIIISIFFSYSNYQPSITEFRREFLNIFIIMLISLGISNKNLIKIFFYAILIAFIYNIFIYTYEYLQNNPKLNFSIRLQRDFTDYFEKLYPFVLISFFILKNKAVRFLLFFLLIIGYFDLILTGARGAWITVIIESILFIIIIILIKKQLFKKILLSSTIILLTCGTIFLYIYNTSTFIQHKLKQGIEPSGRDKIVQTRLPIFLKHGNYLIGIGGPGNYQYNKFLNDYNAPKIYGNIEGKKFHYWSDEPFLLQIFYKEGILGLTLFIWLSFLLLSNSIKYILKNNNNLKVKYLLSAVIISFTGEYFIRGIVEGRSFKYLVLSIILFIIFTYTKEKSENSIYLS